MPRQPLTDEELEVTRTRILLEAAIIVGKSGIAGLSMRGLAQRIGLTPGALYRYFPSKQDILLSYWEDALQAVAERIAAIDVSETDTPAAIRHMLYAYANFCLEDHDRFRLLFLEMDQEVGPELFQRSAGFAPYDLVLRRIERALKDGHFLSTDAELLTQTLWAGVHGAVTLLITVKEIELKADLLDTTINALMRGLSAKET
ncbi:MULTISPECIES: TetR/AcrR family transcriptional regulator [Agrobacterium]|uniref:TetR/AcrR family transcriptional regulator n=1 Tax=Agrobacterium tumefaciens TaxID=358 RepID=UPI001574E8CE|nr:TetR/AcrR family transcriptional regulator [Agrobacterium tumefaciens]NSZ09395.1 TetR/AcrR family transcriptional regulator [Agrobacterium tumefaciens]